MLKPGLVVVGLVAKLCPTLATPWAVARQAPLSMEFSRQEYCLALLQGIFPTQGSNPGLLYCRQICFPWSYQGGPRSEEGTTRSSCVQLGGNAWQFNSSYSFQTVFQLVKRPSVWWLSSISRKDHSRKHQKIPLLWSYSPPAAGAKHCSCRSRKALPN